MIVLNVFNKYEIRNKLKYIISNNISFNKIFIKYLVDILYKKDMFYNVEQKRLRCNNYIINLIIYIFFFEKTINDYEYLKNVINSFFNAQSNQ